jgi:hypothetical protein
MSLRLLVLASLLAAGCAKDVTKDLEDLGDRACGCADKKDVACGKAVVADIVTLAENKNPKGDEARSAAAARKIAECLTKVDPSLMTDMNKQLGDK